MQDLRAALLRLVTHLVAANSSLVPLCLRVLAMGLQPPPTPPVQLAPGEPLVSSEQWEPSPEIVEIQGQVIAALEKVIALGHPVAALLFVAMCCSRTI